MIIRVTKKILNTSGIKLVKNLNEVDAPLPGEWYAGLVSTGRQGKMLIYFLHSATNQVSHCPLCLMKKQTDAF